MGRKKSRTQRKDFKNSRENVWKRTKSDEQQPQLDEGNNKTTTENKARKPNLNWEPFLTQNIAFEEYYKEQGIVTPEEWDTFMACLRSALPAAFRINSSNPFYKEILFKLENDFMITLQDEDANGSEVAAIRPLPWYPDNLAWHSNFSRKQLRKNQILERFHAFLKLENEIGNITRQEAVSMVPPLFLDVRPDHFVLDMCAAPGSKTFQLLEMIHKLTGSLPSGMVIANDVDVQRCNLLIHQTKRMCTANLIVTTHEAQNFPSCHFKRVYAHAPDSGVQNKPEINKLLFDRVLCDVPCSGDGTLRKAPDIWKRWNGGMGIGLHGLQVLIAMRGLSLLKVGGRMVYSTCSMNPVENEAVVAELLRRCKGAVELLDVSTELPQLIRRPGLKTWKVRDKGMWLTSFKDVKKNRKAAVTPSMFPSGKTYEDVSADEHDTSTGELCESDANNKPENGSLMEDSVVHTNCLEKEVSTLPLEYCMRIVPHDQNTGAFFIAVLHKLSSLPAVEKKSVNSSGKVRSFNNLQAEKAVVEIKEDLNRETENSIPVLDGQVSEADMPISGITSVADIRDDEMIQADVDNEDNRLDNIQGLDGQVSEVDMPVSGTTSVADVRDDEMVQADVDIEDSRLDNIQGLDGQVSEVDMPVSGTTSVADVRDDEMVQADVDIEDSRVDNTQGLLPPGGVNNDDGIVSEENECKEIQPSSNITNTEAARGKRKLPHQGRGLIMDPVLFYNEEAIISKIKEFYGMDDTFQFLGHLVTRNSDTNHVKRIYYVSNSVKEVLELNLASGQPLKIASVGVKMFERQTSKEGTSSPCIFRISSEGLPLILPYITKQILYASVVDFKNLLQYRCVKFTDFTDAEFGDKASKLMLGCCVVVLKDNITSPDDNQVNASPVAIGCWRGRTNVSTMVPAVDCEELLERMIEKLELVKPAVQESEPPSSEAVEVSKASDDAESMVIPPA